MEGSRLPQPVHEKDETPPAPGELELVRGFLSLHDHERGNPDALSPAPESLRWWLASNRLIPPRAKGGRSDLIWGLRIRSALISTVRENMGEPSDRDAARVLERAAEETGLRPSFASRDDRPIHVHATGVRGAIGTLLGIAFLAELDGRWERFRICNDPGCSAVFYDRSRNRTGKWCSMATCGNRAKVRAFRARAAV